MDNPLYQRQDKDSQQLGSLASVPERVISVSMDERAIQGVGWTLGSFGATKIVMVVATVVDTWWYW